MFCVYWVSIVIHQLYGPEKNAMSKRPNWIKVQYRKYTEVQSPHMAHVEPSRVITICTKFVLFVPHLYNVDQHCTNVIQMFCVYWVSIVIHQLYGPEKNAMSKRPNWIKVQYRKYTEVQSPHMAHVEPSRVITICTKFANNRSSG